jgi:hypothetical protein
MSEALYKRITLRTLVSLQRRSPEQEEEIKHLEQDIKSLESEEELSSVTIFIDKCMPLFTRNSYINAQERRDDRGKSRTSDPHYIHSQ